MNDDLKGISRKLDEIHQDHIRGRYENLGFILWAFSLAVLGISVAIPHPFLWGTAIAFLIVGCMVFVYSRRVRTKQDVGKPVTVGGKHILIRLARWFEWVFATVLMTTITVIVSLKYLDGCGRCLLLAGLGIFLVATVISQFDQAGWSGRRGGG